MNQKLPEENALSGVTVLDDWVLKEEIGRGNRAVVYKAIDEELEVDSACKLIPESELIPGWKKEIKKCGTLYGLQNVVQFKEYGKESVEGRDYICIIMELVDGPDLEELIKNEQEKITLPFIQTVLKDLLKVMHAMEQNGIVHGDLHTGNVLLTYSDNYMGDQPVVKVNDFGIGGSKNYLDPKNDYAQIADIALDLLETIDRDELNSESRFYFDFLCDDFIPKRLLEKNPTQGEFVQTPKHLSQILDEGWQEAQEKLEEKHNIQLENPFDYLSCEQMGDSFELIEGLYSKNFPGYNQVRSNTHTILTGPRGCGKTTILKNMSLETKIQAGSISSLESIDFVGVYYHSMDLYFAFHYLGQDLDTNDQKLLIHYLSLALFKEFIDTFDLLNNHLGIAIPSNALRDSLAAFSEHMEKYSLPPEGTNLTKHIESMLTKEMNRVTTALRRDSSERPRSTLPADFLPTVCQELLEATKLNSDVPIFFLIDDYSTPKISEPMQKSLNDLLMTRWNNVYFKVSTESVTTFHQFDSSGKMLEESREFETVDLAAHFFGDRSKRKEFLKEVLNTRLENTAGIDDKYTDIEEILGESHYDSFNDLARQIRSDEQVRWKGFKTLYDLFSGDMSEILRLVRGMFETEEPNKDWTNDSIDLPISAKTQNKQIKRQAGTFLNKIEAAQDTTTNLKRIAEVFGEQAHMRLMKETSKNQSGNPPFQAFRLEIRDSFLFEPNRYFETVANKMDLKEDNSYTEDELITLVEDAKTVYEDLLRYGVFLMDPRGKSIRGGVVPRLYLRRLLLPIFNLTPSQRDNIDMEPAEFLFLLVDPEGFDNARPHDTLLDDYLEEDNDENSASEDDEGDSNTNSGSKGDQ